MYFKLKNSNNYLTINSFNIKNNFGFHILARYDFTIKINFKVI
jgi:hypothetical protein